MEQIKKLSCCKGEDETTRKKAADRVFETARELFYRRGIRAVGVDEIVAQAGVTKPSLYRAFGSKDELVAACLEENAREGRLALQELLATVPDEPRAQLRAIVRFYAAKISDPWFRGCPMSNTAVEFPDPGHPGRVVLEACKTEVRELCTTISRKLPIAEPEMLADGLILLIEGAMASHQIFGCQGPPSALISTGDALIAAYTAELDSA